MRDWRSLVEGRLCDPRLGISVDAALCEELAGHLEDVYDAARHEGCSEAEAIARARACLREDDDLAAALSATTAEEAVMNDRIRTLWLPGLTTAAAAALLLATVVASVPAVWWVDPRSWLLRAVAAAVLAGYAGLGALAAAWSARLGGSPRTRLGAALCPLLLQTVVLVPAAVADVAFALQHAAPPLAALRWTPLLPIVAPAAALTLGASPYLRRRPAR